jgi:hypothetical protein
MANRLTDTTIWKKQKWFKKLNIEHKLAWKYLTDECDHAGVWKIDLSELLDDLGLDDFDFDLFVSCCNCDFDKKTGKGIKRQRIMKFNDDYIWITGFMNFQYGGKTNIISVKNNAVISAVNLLKSLNLYELGKEMNYFFIEGESTPSKPFKAPSTPLKPCPPLTTPLNPPEHHKEKEKENDKDNSKVFMGDSTIIPNKDFFKFKLHGFDEIEVFVLCNCEKWQFKEMRDFIKFSQQNFEAIAMNNPLMNVEDNFRVVIQEFINIIQSTNDYKESSELRKYFGNWVSKKNGTLAKFIENCKNKEKVGDDTKKKSKNLYI